MRRDVLTALGLLLCVMLCGCGQAPADDGDTGNALIVYCAAGIKPAVQSAADAYTEETGRAVTLQFGGSGTLLSQLKLHATGDLYLAADASYLDTAADEGLVAERLLLATQRLVIAVPADADITVTALANLRRDGLRLGLANPDQAAVGRVTRAVLTRAGEWDAVSAHATVFKPTVNDLLTDVALGTLDAAVVWDATAAQSDDVRAIHLPELDAAPYAVEVGVLTCSEDATAALHFARYLAARDRGAEHFESAGFQPVPRGDVWADAPAVQVYLGSMLRAGAAETIRAFEQREGCTVDTVYNGCGILVAQMKAGATPDAYFACDVSYVRQVADRFGTLSVVSQNDLVLAVPRGNPAGIHTADDLRGDGVTFGLCDPAMSALGGLTTAMLDGAFGEAGRRAIYDRAAVQVATGDQLVLQMLAGALEAAIVYRSNVASTPSNADRIEVIPLDLPGSRATQPWSTADDTDHAQLLGRLRDALSSDASKGRFEAAGFLWGPQPPAATDTFTP